ncbi:major facilitator superfamily transporter [Xylariaceae sp. FL0594]|nr:major facilitator superfamily transporter [Xylariaceae sp. FL0594]
MQEQEELAAASSEHSPFLPERERERLERPSTPSSPTPATSGITTADGGGPLPTAPKSHAVANLLCLVILVAASAAGFTYIPLTRLVEDAFCRQYYGSHAGEIPDGPIDERLCKDRHIQTQVAFVFAVSGALDAVVGFLAALPWGMAADRIGRRPVLALALLGGSLSCVWWLVVLWLHPLLPIWLGFISSAALFLGGGNAVMMAVVLSIITDVTTEETRAVFFMRLHTASMVGNLVSPGLSSVMMNLTGPWPVMLVGIACLLISAAAAVLFIPETGRRPEAKDTSESHPSDFKTHIKHALEQFKHSLPMLRSPSLAILLVTSLLAQPIMPATMQLMIQYVSKRYDMAIKDTGFVQMIYGAAQAFQALVGLPILSRVMMATMTTTRSSSSSAHRHSHGVEQRRDLALARCSFFILVPGLLLLGVAPTLATLVFGLLVLSLGSGFNSFTKSLMSLYVDHAHRSRLFSLVGMVEVVGSVYSGPMLAGLFSSGMKRGGVWIGLPYFVLSSITAVASVLLLLVQVPQAKPPAGSGGRTSMEFASTSEED